MSLVTDSISEILDNFADAIEGGNTYRGSGDNYKGIPSALSFNRSERTGMSGRANGGAGGAAGGVGFLDTAIPILEAIEIASREDSPPYFLICKSQIVGSGNVGAARKITTISVTGSDSFSFRVVPDFPENVNLGDTWDLMEGFRRMRDITDIESDAGIAGSFDRVFSLKMIPGKRMPIYGNGYEWYESTLELSLRLLKKGRERTARESLLENIQRMRTILTRLDLRGNFVQLVDILDTEPEVTVDDLNKVVVKDKYRVRYRIDSTYL